jgi:hypothetical protein
MFKNRLLTRIFGHKRYELIGGWRKLHDEELYNLYSSTDISMIKSGRMSWAGHVACIGEKSAYRVLIGKHEGKRTLGKCRHIWEDNIKMNLR